MFGIFYLIFNRAIFGVAKIKEEIDNEDARDRAYKNGNLTYYSTKGETLVSNNRQVYRTIVNGDEVLKDVYNGDVYKNYSEEKRNIKEHKAKEQGKTVIPVHYEENQEYNRLQRFNAKTISIKPTYRDIKTRKFYITVRINGLGFYMDIISGELVRLQDEENMCKKWGKLSVEDIIEVFNQRQKALVNIPQEDHDFMWWEEHFYLKHVGFNTLFIDNDKNIIEGNYKNDLRIKQIRMRLIEEGKVNE